MLNNDELLKVITADVAEKVVNSLDEESRKVIIGNAVMEILDTRDFKWEIGNVIDDEAKEYAREYIRKPEVTEKIKQKVIEGVAQTMNNLSKAMAKSVETDLKNEYRKWSEESTTHHLEPSGS